ncbi:Uncharacterised protein [Segatella copri]|nr:Uncharacterised protein [Segatella copri]
MWNVVAYHNFSLLLKFLYKLLIFIDSFLNLFG